VATLSGLRTAANVRALFQRELGVSPSTYRRTYQGKHAVSASTATTQRQ
jgi:transcriptional regulator GlxA family with amidase domain